MTKSRNCAEIQHCITKLEEFPGSLVNAFTKSAGLGMESGIRLLDGSKSDGVNPSRTPVTSDQVLPSTPSWIEWR